MNGTRRKQHLERFADPQGQVWAFDKSMDRVFATSPAQLARESGFYEAPALGNEIDQTASGGSGMTAGHRSIHPITL